MPVRTEHLINETLNSANESISATHDFGGTSPTRITLYIEIVETQDNGSPTTTLTVELSPDKASNFITYDKLLDHNGTDAPQSSIAYTATIDDIVALSPEDVVDYIKVKMTGSADMDAGDFHVVNVWMVWAY